ncbi:MAG TPA: YfiR family protein [Bacteroidales bacterium]|nr:YfiR family protein [Bacteroidales bacterium]
MRKLIVLCILFFSANSLFAQEETVIAAAIYNFTRQVDWPSSNGEFTIDVIGHKSVYDKLNEMIKGRKVGNSTISVRFLESITQITQSEILFVGFWQSKDFTKIQERVSGKNTLIITEKDGMIDNGSAINFVIRNNGIKFEIKRTNIEKYGLKVSDALINLAYKAY